MFLIKNRVNLNKLEYLNCEGCEKISDNAFKYLLMSFAMLDSNNPMKESPHIRCYKKTVVESQANKSKNEIKQSLNNPKLLDDCNECVNKSRLNNIEEIFSTETNANSTSNDGDYEHNCSEHNRRLEAGLKSLRSINLAGCWSVTDYGLR